MNSTKEFAVFGGPPEFSRIRSTSNLVQPDPERFFEYARRSYDAGWLSNNGPAVKLLESRLAALHGTRHCVATCNGLWALVLCIHCLQLPGRREILMPSLTYRRMADIAAWLNLVPHFCDVDPRTLGLSPDAVREAMSDRVGLVLAAHPIVHMCDIEALETVAKDFGVPLLVDAVEAAYAELGGRRVGSFGAAECFSMHASKFLNGFEAGYITTNDTELADRLRKMRAFGFYGRDHVEEFGLNAKLNEFHAAMGLAALDDLEDQVERNKARYDAFRTAIAAVPGLSLVEYEETEARTFKNILVRLESDWPLTREQTLKILHAENMLARPYYFPPLHDKPTVYSTITGRMDNTNRLKQLYMLLPSGEFLSTEDMRRVAQFLDRLQAQGREVANRLGQGG